MKRNKRSVSDRNRAIYRTVENMLKKIHGEAKAKDLIISPSYLRAEVALSNNKSTYAFDLKKTGNEVATEVKLDRNDLFVVTNIGLFMSLQFGASVGKEVLQSYPNIQVFPAAATGLVAADLEAVYNGSTSLKIASRVNIENLSNLEFRYVPSSQQAAATTKSENNLLDSTYEPATIISLHGTMDIKVETTFPSYAGIGLTPTSAADGVTKLVLMPFGFLVKGGAQGIS